MITHEQLLANKFERDSNNKALYALWGTTLEFVLENNILHASNGDNILFTVTSLPKLNFFLMGIELAEWPDRNDYENEKANQDLINRALDLFKRYG